MGSRYQLEPDGFTEKCLLRVYDDGSVLLEHSGLEVGQGMDTKALQACTMALRKISAPELDSYKTILQRAMERYGHSLSRVKGG